MFIVSALRRDWSAARSVELSMPRFLAFRTLMLFCRFLLYLAPSVAPDCFSSTKWCSKARPLGWCTATSRISSFGCTVNRRTNLVHSPFAHVRNISTVRLSTRREDCFPEQPKSWKSLATASKYRIVLELVFRPSASVVSRVNTSPLECGSKRNVRIWEWESPNVERAGFTFHIPNAWPKQLVARSADARRIRTPHNASDPM